jgi:hypothetical protein
MLAALDLPSASLALACSLGAVAIFLGLREWYERNARDPDLSDVDYEHFQRQDRRRGMGIGVLLLLAMLLPLGSSLTPGPNSDENLSFLIIWILVLALVVALLVLAVLDWLATRTYARRHRKQILRESIESIRQSAQAENTRPARDGNGTEDSPPSSQF